MHVARPVSYPAPPSNLAVQKLRALDGSLQDLGDKLGCSAASLSEWRRERKTPSRVMRERVSRAYAEILPDDWERAPADVPDPPTEAEAVEAELDPAQVDNLDGVLHLLREIRVAARDPSATPATRERLAAREIVARKFIAHLQDKARFEQDTIVRAHPDWQRVRELLVQAVSGCADCATKVCEALRAV